MKLTRLEDVTPEMIPHLRYGKATPEEMAEIYRLASESFTAADLAAFFSDEPRVPARLLLEEMEENQRKFDNGEIS
jgi:hypothetical protein